MAAKVFGEPHVFMARKFVDLKNGRAQGSDGLVNCSGAGEGRTKHPGTSTTWPLASRSFSWTPPNMRRAKNVRGIATRVLLWRR